MPSRLSESYSDFSRDGSTRNESLLQYQIPGEHDTDHRREVHMAIMSAGERAAQIWAVLALAARNRQILTYEIVGRLIGVPARASDTC